MRGKEGELDLWLTMDVPQFHVNLIVECKKHNPDFVDWIFFPPPGGNAARAIALEQIVTQTVEMPSTGWRAQQRLWTPQWSGQRADDARETRGNYEKLKSGDKTKTSNASVTDAAFQAALGTKCILGDEYRLAEARGRREGATAPEWETAIFVPVIVTTANLFLCTFDAADVNPARGELGPDKAKLIPVDEVLYEYALPRRLQPSPADLGAVTDEQLQLFTCMPIIIVQSARFEGFLASFMKPAVPSA